ncbi:hypothetical protein GGF31_004619 [Allomyces arbusculus]|nr:hypothetical protein GGF31_004619 [Allomyces arbusculus]
MFSRVTATFYVHLAPKFVGAPMRGVEDHLNRMLLKYNDQVGGVVLSYRNVQFLSDTAAILYDSPFMHFHISAELLAFAPTAGARLTGVINKQSPSHIGLLVYNLFNASIPAAQLPDGAFTFQFDDSAAYAPTGEGEAEGDDGESAPRFNKGGKKAMINGNWIHAASGSVLEPGHALDFIVTEVVKSHDFISMKGTLVGVEYVPPPPTAVPTTPSAAAPSQRITFGDDDDEEEAMEVEPAAVAPKKSKKSKKPADGGGDDASGDADRKKRKRKLSQSAAKEPADDDAAAQQPVEAAAPAPVVAEVAGKKDKKKSKATNDGEKSSKKRKKE